MKILIFFCNVARKTEKKDDDDDEEKYILGYNKLIYPFLF